MVTIQIADKPTLDKINALVDQLSFYNTSTIKTNTLPGIEDINTYRNAKQYNLTINTTILCDKINVKVVPSTMCTETDDGYEITQDGIVYVIQNSEDQTKFYYTII